MVLAVLRRGVTDVERHHVDRLRGIHERWRQQCNDDGEDARASGGEMNIQRIVRLRAGLAPSCACAGMARVFVLAVLALLAAGEAEAQSGESLSAAANRAAKQWVWAPSPRQPRVGEHTGSGSCACRTARPSGLLRTTVSRGMVTLVT